jgi:hypothetical protein
VLRRELDDLLSVKGEEHVVELDHGAGAAGLTEGSFQIVDIPDLHVVHGDARRPRGEIGLPRVFGVPRICGVRQESDARKLRHGLPEQFQPLPHEIRMGAREAGDVSARPGKAGHHLRRDGVDRGDEHDGDRARGPPGCHGRRRPGREKHVHLATDELRGGDRELIGCLREAVFDDDVLSLDLPEVAQPLSKAVDERLGGRTVAQEAQAPHSPRLLCLGDGSRSQQAAQRGEQEAATLHAGTVRRLDHRTQVRRP